MKWEFEKQFREKHPETIGETDHHFDLVNYKDFLEDELLKSRSLVNAADTGTDKCHIQNVSNMLPDGYWFDDEHGTTVTVIGIVDKWCMVEDIEHEEPYVLPLEYVISIYEESKEGNYC